MNQLEEWLALVSIGVNGCLAAWVWLERRGRRGAERRAGASKHAAEAFMRDVKENGDRYADEIQRLRKIIENYRAKLAQMRDDTPSGVRRDISRLLRGEDTDGDRKGTR